jgi:metal-sulfur cluster biosynthetic enzyme
MYAFGRFSARCLTRVKRPVAQSPIRYWTSRDGRRARSRWIRRESRRLDADQGRFGTGPLTLRVKPAGRLRRAPRAGSTPERSIAMTAGMPDDEAVREALRAVDDPEAGMNVVDLGLVYRVDVGADAVHVELTMTTAACPMTDMIVGQARDEVARIVPIGTHVAIVLVRDPPWTPDKMTAIAKEHFGWTFRRRTRDAGAAER